MAVRWERGLRILLLILGMIAFQAQSVAAAGPKVTSIVMTSPTACPSAGCAAGQHLNFKVDFDLGSFLDTLNPNVQVCVYTPTNWAASLFSISLMGGVTGLPYSNSILNCDVAPAGYQALGGAIAQLPAGSFGDALNFGLRIDGTATSGGSVVVRVFEQSAAGTWLRTGQAFTSVSVIPSSSTMYAANDAAACSTNSPCYLNSGDDLANGIGTGLQDAIDSRSTAGSITILGNYLIKDHTILVDAPHTIQGAQGSALTYSGSVCTQSMLKVTGAAILRNLNIRDGSCTTTSRDLVAVESTSPVLIENSTLINGNNAILLTDANNGNVTLRFSQVTGNSSYAIFLSPANTGMLEAVGNNLFGNRSGIQVECNNLGRVEHNFWGNGVAAATGASRCSVSEAKRLGTAALINTSGFGVVGSRVTVSDVKAYFMNAVGYSRTGGSNFDLYIIDHGNGSSANIPFTAGSSTNLNPCSSYWDIFLAENANLTPDVVLSLFFKYDLSSGCIATISSTRYCNQPLPMDATQFPLYWYDPVTFPTNLDWATTGSTGQTTTCQVANNEISLDVDLSGRPSLTDLSFLPFVVGLPGQPTAVDIVSARGDSSGLNGWLSVGVACLGLLLGMGLAIRKGGRHEA